MAKKGKDHQGPKPQPSPFDLPAEQDDPLPTKEEESPPITPEPRQDAPKDMPSEEVVAATDEFFKQEPVRPTEQDVAATDPDSPMQPPSDSESSLPEPDEAERAPSPLRDYVRELQQEFEEEEEEGKI